MKPLPARRWQRTLWRQNTVHPDYHIAIDRHFYSVPHEYVGKQVDVRLRGQVIDVFHRGRQIASHLRSDAKGRATTVEEHRPVAHRRAGVENTRARLEQRARDLGPHVHDFVAALMARQNNPEYGFRSCYGVLRLASNHTAGTLRQRLPLRAGARHPDLSRPRQHPAHRRRSRRRRDGARDRAHRPSQHQGSGVLQMTETVPSHPVAERLTSLRLPGMKAAFLEQIAAESQGSSR